MTIISIFSTALLKRNLRFDIVCIVLSLTIAAVIRLHFLWEYQGHAFFEKYRLDSEIYDHLAKAFASGNFLLTNEPLHLSPLYSYFLGVLYYFFGSGGWAARIIQFAMGLMTLLLVFSIAQKIFESSKPKRSSHPNSLQIACLAIAIGAFFGPSVFYEAIISASALGAFILVFTVWYALNVERHLSNTKISTKKNPQKLTWSLLILGGLCGLNALVRPNALLLVPLFAALLGQDLKSKLRFFIWILAAAVIVISPITIRNYYVSENFVLVTDTGGLNFYLGNGPGANGSFRIPDEIPKAKNASAQLVEFRKMAESDQGRDLSPSEIDSYWFRKTLNHIQQEPFTWIQLMVKKLKLFWQGRDLENTHSYEFHHEIFDSLKLAFVSFGWIAPFALLGIFWMLKSRRRPQILVASTAVVFCFSTILFFVLGHYRYLIVPILWVCASYGFIQWISSWKQKSKQVFVLQTIFLALTLGLSFSSSLEFYRDDEYFKMGFAFHTQERWQEAAKAYHTAIELNPNQWSALKNLAYLYETLKQPESAIEFWTVLKQRAQEQKMTEYQLEAEKALERLGKSIQK